MKHSFPDLNNNQVALVRAEKNTGHVLDEKLVLALNDNQKIFTIFDSFRDAQLYAEEALLSNNKIEIVIYSDQQ